MTPRIGGLGVRQMGVVVVRRLLIGRVQRRRMRMVRLRLKRSSTQ